MENLAENLFKDIKKLEKKYSLSAEEILKLLQKKEDIAIPFSIFNEKLGSLESIVKFLRENLNLSYKEISFLTSRKQQPIRTTYERAKRKLKLKFEIKESKKIPISILSNRNFSVLESIVYYMIKSGFSTNEISSILKRDYQTVWTIMNKIKNKT